MPFSITAAHNFTHWQLNALWRDQVLNSKAFTYSIQTSQAKDIIARHSQLVSNHGVTMPTQGNFIKKKKKKKNLLHLFGLNWNKHYLSALCLCPFAPCINYIFLHSHLALKIHVSQTLPHTRNIFKAHWDFLSLPQSCSAPEVPFKGERFLLCSRLRSVHCRCKPRIGDWQA